MKIQINLDVIIVLIIATILIHRVIDAYVFTTQSRTMFQYGDGSCKMDNDYLINCDNTPTR